MHLYTAEISSTFLDELNFAAVMPSAPTSVSIYITTIPYEV